VSRKIVEILIEIADFLKNGRKRSAASQERKAGKSVELVVLRLKKE
jgi:hypothetical protein